MAEETEKILFARDVRSLPPVPNYCNSVAARQRSYPNGLSAKLRATSADFRSGV